MIFIVILNDTIVFLFHFRGKLEFRNLNVNLDLDLDLNTYEVGMEKNVNMLDQLILLVQLPDVSVINTNGYS